MSVNFILSKRGGVIKVGADTPIKRDEPHGLRDRDCGKVDLIVDVFLVVV